MALVTPVFFVLFSDNLTMAILRRISLMSIVYANVIGVAANSIIPRLFRGSTLWGPLREWTILIFGLLTVSGIGCLLGSVLLVLMKVVFGWDLFPWSDFWFGLGYTFRICAFMTLGFGIIIRVYEGFRVHLTAMELRLRTQELERERAIKLAAEARLASLEAHLHPHFLFNTLSSISSLIPHDPVRAERLVERVAALLRFSLDAQRGGVVPLAQELRIVHDYLEIEQARLGGRLRYRVAVGEHLSELLVPPLSIQTLVENSVKFAIAPNRGGGEIRVKVNRTDACLRIDVLDTGSGFSFESVPQGHGLDNLRNRMAVLFGNAAQLSVERTIDGWTAVTMKVPA